MGICKVGDALIRADWGISQDAKKNNAGTIRAVIIRNLSIL
jgi:hypothetical protein